MDLPDAIVDEGGDEDKLVFICVICEETGGTDAIGPINVCRQTIERRPITPIDRDGTAFESGPATVTPDHHGGTWFECEECGTEVKDLTNLARVVYA